jgi:hypothetical protein
VLREEYVHGCRAERSSRWCGAVSGPVRVLCRARSRSATPLALTLTRTLTLTFTARPSPHPCRDRRQQKLTAADATKSTEEAWRLKWLSQVRVSRWP